MLGPTSVNCPDGLALTLVTKKDKFFTPSVIVNTTSRPTSIRPPTALNISVISVP